MNVISGKGSNTDNLVHLSHFQHNTSRRKQDRVPTEKKEIKTDKKN